MGRRRRFEVGDQAHPPERLRTLTCMVGEVVAVDRAGWARLDLGDWGILAVHVSELAEVEEQPAEDGTWTFSTLSDRRRRPARK